MNYLSMTFLAMLLILLVFTGISLFTAIHGNYRRASELRRQFGQRIRLIPLFRMLQQKGVSLEQWLHLAPVATIENAVRQCESCPRTEDCLVLLRKSQQAVPGHCSNEALLDYLAVSPGGDAYVAA